MELHIFGMCENAANHQGDFPMRKILILTSALIAITGCSAIDSIMSPNPNIVATLESTLAAADTAAMAYMTLPRCGSVTATNSPMPTLCSDSGVATTINTARAAAFTAVKAAEANETADTVTSAENAVMAFQALVPAAGTSATSAVTPSS